MEGEPPPQQTYQHVAFAVSEADLPLYETRLRALGGGDTYSRRGRASTGRYCQVSLASVKKLGNIGWPSLGSPFLYRRAATPPRRSQRARSRSALPARTGRTRPPGARAAGRSGRGSGRTAPGSAAPARAT